MNANEEDESLRSLLGGAQGRGLFAQQFMPVRSGVPYFSGTTIPILGRSVVRPVSSGLLEVVSSSKGPLDYLQIYMVLDDYIDFGPLGATPEFLRERIPLGLRGISTPEELLELLGILTLSRPSSEHSALLADEFSAQLAPPSRARFEAVRSRRVFLARQPILAAFRDVLTDAPSGGPEIDVHPLAGAVMLVHSIAWGLGQQAKHEEAVAGFTPLSVDLVRNQVFNDSEDPYAVIDRYQRLWHTYGPLSADLLEGDAPAELFLAATGLEVDDMLALGFAVYSLFFGWKPGSPAVLADLNSDMDEARQSAFISLVSATPADFTQAFADRASEWDFLPFQRRPVIRTPKGLLVVDDVLLIERVTSSMYWDVHDHQAQKGSRQRVRWTQAWGRMVELLVEDCLRPFAPLVLGGGETYYTEDDLRRAYPDHKRADVILDMGDAVVPVEIVSGQLRVETRIGGDPAALRGDIERLVLKKARQLDDTSRCLVTSPGALMGDGIPIRTVQPIIVAGGGFPVSPVTVRYIQQCFRDENLFSHPMVRPPAIIDLGELEMLEGIRERGRSLTSVLTEWQSSSLSELSLRNYLIDRFPHDWFRPARMESRVAEAFNSIRSRLRLRDDPSPDEPFEPR